MGNDNFTENLEKSIETFKDGFLAYVVGSAIAILVSLFVPIIAPPLIYGLTSMAIKGAKGEKAQVEDIFVAFLSMKRFIRSYLYGIVVFVLLFVMILVFILAAVCLFLIPEEYFALTVAGLIALLLLFIFALIFISFGFIYSNILYVMDEDTGVLKSLSESIALTKENFIATLCSVVLSYILNAVGTLCGGILIVLTTPYSLIFLAHLTFDLKKGHDKKEDEKFEDVKEGEERDDDNYEYVEYEEEYVVAGKPSKTNEKKAEETKKEVDWNQLKVRKAPEREENNPEKTQSEKTEEPKKEVDWNQLKVRKAPEREENDSEKTQSEKTEETKKEVDWNQLKVRKTGNVEENKKE